MEARFPNVVAYPAVEVIVRWSDGAFAKDFLTGEVKANETLELVCKPVTGGRVEVVGSGPGVMRDARPRVLSWGDWGGGASPYGPAEGSIFLKRVVGAPRWTALESLKPGTYEATIAPEDAEGAKVKFEVRAGETTVIPMEIP